MSSKTWQRTATAEEQCNYPKDSTDTDRRRFVGQQNRHSWHRNIFQVDIRKRSDCCADARNAFGSCFLAKVDVTDASFGELRLNTDPGLPLVYLLTAAHNLYCRKHAKYAESIDLVRVKPGRHIQGKESLLKQPVTCVTSNGGRGSFFRVSSFYKNMDGGHQAQTRDFGIICVARDLFHDPQLVASSCLNLLGPVEEQYPLGFVCGFPLYITRNHDAGIDIPQSEYESEVPPNLNMQVDGRSETVDRFYVAGALYEMPAPPLTSLAANGSMQEQERRVAERSSAGLFAFPQKHFDELTPEIVHRTDEHCRQRLYRHYIDTSGGQSGSPVYVVDDTGNVTVVGIHIGVWFYRANAHGKAEFNQDTDCNIAVRLTNLMLMEVIRLTRQEPAVAVESGEAQSLPHPNNVLPYEHEGQMIWTSFAAQKPIAAAGAAAGGAASGGGGASGASDGKTPTRSPSTADTPTPYDPAEAAPVGAADGNRQGPVQEGGAGGKLFSCGGTDSTAATTAEGALTEARSVASGNRQGPVQEGGADSKLFSCGGTDSTAATTTEDALTEARSVASGSGSGQGPVQVSGQDPKSGYTPIRRVEQQVESTPPRPRQQPVPAPRTVHQLPPGNPWDSDAFQDPLCYVWLLQNLAPQELRIYFMKYLSPTQRSELENVSYNNIKHNEKLFQFLRAHEWDSYHLFLKVLSEWPVHRAKKIASDLEKAAGLST